MPSKIQEAALPLLLVEPYILYLFFELFYFISTYQSLTASHLNGAVKYGICLTMLSILSFLLSKNSYLLIKNQFVSVEITYLGVIPAWSLFQYVIIEWVQQCNLLDVAFNIFQLFLFKLSKTSNAF